MATITAPLKLSGCGQSEQVRLERVNYFPRQLLTADDMIADQDYFRERMRRHNRFLHGWGVVCGLEVTAAPTADVPWQVKIGSGYALGPYGDEIDVAEAQTLDLARCLSTTAADPCEPSGPGQVAGQRLYVVIKYSECFASPVLAMPAGCGCEESACEYSRIRDGFEICCLTQLPPSSKPPIICELISQAKLPPCPPCPEDPWVVLAQVDLPALSGTEVTNSMINNIIVRRQIYSTAMLQEQLIRCCCGNPTQPVPVPVQVGSVSPANGSQVNFPAPDKIEVTFNKDVQASTVNAQTIIVNKEGEAPIEGKVTYQAATRTATFVPTWKQGQNWRPGTYSVTVRGSGDPHVKDQDNLDLDGNEAGGGGNDFSSKFTVKLPGSN
jgi:hypothetical protein